MLTSGPSPQATALPTPLTGAPFLSSPPPPPPLQTAGQLRDHLARLLHDASLLTALADELEAIVLLKGAAAIEEPGSSTDRSANAKCAEVPRISGLCETPSLADLGLSTLEAAVTVQQSVECMLAPLVAVSHGTCSWEEAASVARISSRQLKIARNRKWRQRQRRRAAEALHKEIGRYDQADHEADEWRAREIAKDIARRKMEKMKEVAKQKAKEERQKLEEELELVLVVEKLQDLRSLRVQRLKKQGCFLPEEDNTFMERVRVAVEEEERQAAAAADTRAAAAAIASAEEAGKSAAPPALKAEKEKLDERSENATGHEHVGESMLLNKEDRDFALALTQGSNGEGKKSGKVSAQMQDGTLPAEFYHYYHGSNADMGTLIEVRRMWDNFIFPGGSRIPGHWVDPPVPADNVWASCLVTSSEMLSSRRTEF